MLLKNGEIKYVIEKCKTDFSTNDKPLRSIGTVQDITERVLSEKALRESEALLKGAESLAKVGHYYYVIEKDQFHWSDEMFRILGVMPNELQPSYGAFFEFIYEDDKDGLNKAFEKSLREKDVLQIEHRLILRNGEIRYVNHKIRTEFNSKGLPIISMGGHYGYYPIKSRHSLN
ncbi:MAG: PAS domain-containing protein [Chloroflexia bacterium]|nr:PAS domain-containing protein [Chloroflexia bacterium]